MRVMAAGLIAACAAGAALAAPPEQELAGPSRPPAGSAAPQPAPSARPGEPLAAILFDHGSARLTPSGTRVLDGLGRMLVDRLRVESHAGGDRDLAARRAGVVVAYLEQNCGVTAERVQVVTVARADDRKVWVQDLGE